mmetsp:Transcript_119361/g.207212  ORF Transcript_119361/g.207212 Transcript_119361/m.207212 type:complete len:176 (+) Transcript_119361:95-622(+)
MPFNNYEQQCRYFSEIISREHRQHAYHPNNHGQRPGADQKTGWSATKSCFHTADSMLRTLYTKPPPAAGIPQSLRSYQMFSNSTTITRPGVFGTPPETSAAAAERAPESALMAQTMGGSQSLVTAGALAAGNNTSADLAAMYGTMRSPRRPATGASMASRTSSRRFPPTPRDQLR